MVRACRSCCVASSRRLIILTAVVTVADDGGSTGRIREDLDIIAPGDLRNCLVAMADKEGLMEQLLRIVLAVPAT